MSTPEFLIAGFDDDTLTYNEPVSITCCACGTDEEFFVGADQGVHLSVLIGWAKGHVCP